MSKKNLSIFEIAGRDSWLRIRTSVQKGQLPEKGDIEAALRGPYDIPDDMRSFLADYLTGKVRRPRGRPNLTADQWLKRFGRDEWVRSVYRWTLEDIETGKIDKGKDTPSDAAIAILAENSYDWFGERITEATIRRIVWDKNTGVQHSNDALKN